MKLDKIQKFGRYLSNMVQPNIGAFIAWGLITAIFIPTGWFPNEKISMLVGPMISYLLPLLIAYSGGAMVYSHRGGVLGAVMAMGLIVGTSVPMFLGAMIVGPLAAFLMKKIDDILQPITPSGFEMLVNNFSAGFLGLGLSLIALIIAGPAVEFLSLAISNGVKILVDNNLLPFVAILVEPAKVFFLNNAINHGIFSPLGIQQVSELGKSIFFTIESNPGPGLGILLAYMFFGKGRTKASAPGAMIIHFFGGIHEIYFPYVLINPILILPLIAGGMSGIATNLILKGGLVAVPSPGSIFALLAVTPRGGFVATSLSVMIAAAVTFFLGVFFIRNIEDEDLDKATQKSNMQKNISKKIRKIVVACDAGMGSSALGASLLRKTLKETGIDIEVSNVAISNLDGSEDMIITQKTLTDLAKEKNSTAVHMIIENFMDKEFYKEIAEHLYKNKD
ncbi:MAG: PTS mannitol transporter subunit IICB [Brevinema sp.]